MSGRIFLYGTLLPQHAPEEIAPAVAKLRRLGEGAVRGLLFDLGDYPGAVLDESAAGHIYGTIFELPDEEELLSLFDLYEGFDPENVEASLFVRTLCPAALASGEELQCWIYVYNREPLNAHRILSGRYPGI